VELPELPLVVCLLQATEDSALTLLLQPFAKDSVLVLS
jgi:hypothetical protein